MLQKRGLNWMCYSGGDRMILFASKLAACAGMNRYEPQAGLRDEFLRTFVAGANDDYVTPHEQAQAEMDLLPHDDREKIRAAVDTSYATASDVVRALEEVTAPISHVTEVAPAVVEAVRRAMDVAVCVSVGASESDSAQETCLDAVLPACDVATIVAATQEVRAAAAEVDSVMLDLAQDVDIAPEVVAAVRSALAPAAATSEQAGSPSERVMADVLEMLPSTSEAKQRIVTAAAQTRAAAAGAKRAFEAVTAPKAVVRELPPLVVDSIRNAMYTKHGTQQEDVVRQAVAERKAKEIKTSDKFRTSSRPLMTVNGVDVFLGGRHDGMVDGKIVEIKTRQRRFLGTPLYELVQVHAYMHIYGTREALVVESYNGEEREHEVLFDDKLWSRVKTELAAFLGPLLDF